MSPRPSPRPRNGVGRIGRGGALQSPQIGARHAKLLFRAPPPYSTNSISRPRRGSGGPHPSNLLQPRVLITSGGVSKYGGVVGFSVGFRVRNSPGAKIAWRDVLASKVAWRNEKSPGEMKSHMDRWRNRHFRPQNPIKTPPKPHFLGASRPWLFKKIGTSWPSDCSNSVNYLWQNKFRK